MTQAPPPPEMAQRRLRFRFGSFPESYFAELQRKIQTAKEEEEEEEEDEVEERQWHLEEHSQINDAAPAPDASFQASHALMHALLPGALPPHPAGVVGLVNMGNTCFVSTCVQALVACTALRRVLAVYEALCNVDPELAAQTPRLRALHSIWKAGRENLAVLRPSSGRERAPQGAWKGGKAASLVTMPPLAPSELMESVKEFFSLPDSQGFGHQHDIQEFLHWYMDALHDEQGACEARIEQSALCAVFESRCEKRAGSLVQGHDESEDSGTEHGDDDERECPWPEGSHIVRELYNVASVPSIDGCRANGIAGTLEGPSLAQHAVAEGSSYNNNNNDDDGKDGWQEVGANGKGAQQINWSGEFHTSSYITAVFEANMRSSLQKPGSKLSVTVQPFRCLSLDLGRPAIRSVQDALHDFLAPELLEDVPGGRAQGRKTLTFDSLPHVLVLHLKRFAFDHRTGASTKLERSLEVNERLVIPSGLLSQRAQHQVKAAVAAAASASASEHLTPRHVQDMLCTYSLVAAVFHHGSTANAGHYTSAAWNAHARAVGFLPLLHATTTISLSHPPHTTVAPAESYHSGSITTIEW